MKKIYLVNDYDLSFDGNNLILDNLYYDGYTTIGAYDTKEEAIKEAIRYIRDFNNDTRCDCEEDEELRREVWMIDNDVLEKSDFSKLTYYMRGNKYWSVIDIICIEVKDKEEI